MNNPHLERDFGIVYAGAHPSGLITGEPPTRLLAGGRDDRRQPVQPRLAQVPRCDPDDFTGHLPTPDVSGLPASDWSNITAFMF